MSNQNDLISSDFSRRHVLRNGALTLGGLSLGGFAFSGETAARPNGAQVSEFELPERTIPVTNPCTSDRLRITEGVLHLVVHTVEDGAGGVHVNLQAAIKQGKAIGVDSGTTYILTGAASANLTVKTGATGTFTANFNAISRGSRDNLRLKALFHVTVNAAGDVTATLASLAATCRG